MTGIPLRPYQTAALDAVRASLERGVRRQLVVLPTGTGKTHLAVALSNVLGWTTLFVVHRDELVEQTVRSFRQVDPDVDIGVVKAERDEVTAHVVVASAQTLARPARRERLVEALRGAPVLHVVDEAHHALARTWTDTVEAVDAALLVGLTATPSRGDGVGLGHLFDEVTYRYPLLDAVREGYLAEPRGLAVRSSTDLDDVRTHLGDFAEGELERRVNNDDRNQLVLRAWRAKALGRTRTVVFAAGVDHARALADAFRAGGVAAETVFGETPTEERKATLRRFRDGEVPVLVNVNVLSEGYDEPRIDCIVVARPTRHAGFYQQMLGRGLRSAPGKADCLVIDVVDVFKHDLAGFAGLAGAEPRLVAATQRSSEPQGLLEVAAQQAELQEVYERVDLLKERAVRSVEERYARSALAWWTRDDGIRAAQAGDDAYVVLLPRGDEFEPVKVGPAGVTPLLGRAVDEELAAGIAHDQADLSWRTAADAGWRTSGSPPTEKQVAYARRLGLATEGLTKGQLAQRLDAVRFDELARRHGLVPDSRYPELLEVVRRTGELDLTADDGRPVRLNLAGARAKRPGTLNVTDGERYPDNVFYGRVGLEGQLEVRDPVVRRLLALVASRAEDVIREVVGEA